MYSITFAFTLCCQNATSGRFQDAAVMLRMPPRRRPVTGQPATCTSHIRRTILITPPLPASHRPAAHADHAQTAIRTMSSYRGMDASFYLGFVLCCHSNATRAPIANPPNSAQLGGSLTTPPSYIRVRAVVWAYGRGQTHRRA